MAGTTTVTKQPMALNDTGKTVSKITIDWTSDASGNVNGTTIDLFGYLLKAITIPTGSPTDLYDITLADPNSSSLDAAGGKLVDRSGTLSQQVHPTESNASIPLWFSDLAYEFKVANAGNAKSGKCILFVCDAL